MAWQLCFHNDRCFLNTRLLFPKEVPSRPRGSRVSLPPDSRNGDLQPQERLGPDLLLFLVHSGGIWKAQTWRRGVNDRQRRTLTNSKPGCLTLGMCFHGSFSFPPAMSSLRHRLVSKGCEQTKAACLNSGGT